MKKFTAVLACALMLCPLCSCISESSSQKAENKKVLEQAEKNAVRYISEKYGFDADITASEIIYEVKGWDFIIPHSEATTDSLITMKHDGREFQLIISADDENTNGADNYQAEEIKNAFCDIIRSELGEECNIYYANAKMKSGAKEIEADFCNGYFDGEDLSNVLTNLDYCIIELCGADLSDEKKFEKIQQLADCTNAHNFYIASYKSKWAYDKHPIISYLEKCRDSDIYSYRFDMNSYQELDSYRKFQNDGTSEYHDLSNNISEDKYYPAE